MNIEPHDRATFLVTVHGEQFHVDLLAILGNGQCDCWPFKKHIRPRIEEMGSQFQPGPGTRCGHINAARENLLDMFITELRNQFPDNEQTV